jgi:dienelactone hydrolase
MEGLEREVSISSDGVLLGATLGLPPRPRGVVVFAHGTGSGRMSPRNRHVARVLRGASLMTVLLDLLTPEEDAEEMRGGHRRFDVGFLARRLGGAAEWLRARSPAREMALGYFGASTGAAAALVAAAEAPESVAAIVSRGGRPDLAASALPRVQAPTLLIVGGDDEPVLSLNHEAYDRLGCEKKIEIVPGATHLFEEPGALDRVAELARDWFVMHLSVATADMARKRFRRAPGWR